MFPFAGSAHRGPCQEGLFSPTVPCITRRHRMTAWGRLLLSLQVPVAPEDAASPEELELSARLDRKTEVIVRRLGAKRDVTRQLLDGHLTLLEAAALFRQLNATPADCPCSHEMMPGNSDGEKL